MCPRLAWKMEFVQRQIEMHIILSMLKWSWQILHVRIVQIVKSEAILWPLPIQYGVCIKMKITQQQQHKRNPFNSCGCCCWWWWLWYAWLPLRKAFTSFQINLNLMLKTVACYHFTESSRWQKKTRNINLFNTLYHTLLKRFLSMKMWMGSKNPLSRFESIRNIHFADTCTTCLKWILQTPSSFTYTSWLAAVTFKPIFYAFIKQFVYISYAFNGCKI